MRLLPAHICGSWKLMVVIATTRFQDPQIGRIPARQSAQIIRLPGRRRERAKVECVQKSKIARETGIPVTRDESLAEQAAAWVPPWSRPAEEQPTAEEPTEQPVAEQPAAEQAAEQPAAGEPAEQPAAGGAAEQPVAERPAEQLAVEEPEEQPAAEGPATAPAEEPVAERPAEQLAVDEPAGQPVDEPAGRPVAEADWEWDDSDTSDTLDIAAHLEP